MTALRRRERARHFQGPRYARSGAWLVDLETVTSQLDAIIRGNFFLLRGLEMAALEAPRVKVRAVLMQLTEDLAGGIPLSESLARMDRFFPGYYVDMVRAAEASGQLAGTFDKLRERIWDERVWRQKLAGFTLYTLAVLYIQLGIAAFLAAYVAPTFLEMHEDFESPEEPWALVRFTAAAGSSETLRVVIVCAVAIIILPWIWRLIRGPMAKGGLMSRAITRGSLYIPVIRSYTRKRHLAQPLRVVSLLVDGGLPLDQALDQAAGMETPRVFARAMQRAARRVRQGSPINEAFEAERHLPPSLCVTVSIAASSADLAPALSRLADVYQRDALTFARVATDCVLPAAVILIGVFTFLVNFAFFSAIVALSETGVNWI